MFHFIGDVHGNSAQLVALLRELGYVRPDPDGDPHLWEPPAGKQLVSVGDIVDRGPDSLGCLRILARMSAEGHARMVLGNHEIKATAVLRAQLGLGEEPQLAIGRRMTWTELLGLTDREKRELLAFIEGLPTHLDLDEGKVIVVHARWDAAARRAPIEDRRQLLVRGKPEPTGKEPMPDGNHPIPYDTLALDAPLLPKARWVRGYNGRSLVVWGHSIIRRGAVIHIGNTVNVESGVMNGHPLSAWSYPEDEVTQVPGPVPWRTAVKPYKRYASVAFPRTLGTVEELVDEYGVTDEDEYIEALVVELAGRGAPEPYPQLEAAHRRLYRRYVQASR